MTTSAEAIRHLGALVGFNSVSCNSNIAVIDYIESQLAPLGFACIRVPAADGVKCNFLARIGPDVEGGMVLSGHTDVVPVEGQAWDSDPFTLTEKDGKLFGRGTCDMKGFIACCLAIAPQLAKKNLNKPVYFAFSYDEEVGCIGVPHLLQFMKGRVPSPAFAIIGEPTLMQVATTHKGVLSFETIVTGVEAHSSQPHRGVNSIHIACELVHFLTEMGKTIASEGPHNTRFEPAHSTVHVGIIHGGVARNIIAKECRLVWEIRPIPGADPDAWLKQFEDYCGNWRTRMKAFSPQADIVTRPMSRMMGVSLPKSAGTDLSRVMRAAQTNDDIAVAFATEAGVFNEFGIPSIICGPGSIDQAHQPNEFIAAGQMHACVDFLQRLTENF